MKKHTRQAMVLLMGCEKTPQPFGLTEHFKNLVYVPSVTGNKVVIYRLER